MKKLQCALSRPDHKAVKIVDSFWGKELEKINTTTVWDVLNKFEHDHEAGIMKNYEWVAQNTPGDHIGPPWYDGLICEVIRGVSDLIATNYDAKLDEKIEYYTQMISKAQDADPDGYINTYTTLICPAKRWGENGGSLVWQHETYNIGCLVEAGIHYYKATGKIKLLACGIKAANCLCGVIGDTPRKNIVPAHSLAEEAMVKLYRLLSETPKLSESLKADFGVTATAKDYLDLAKFWMDHRGIHTDRASFPHYMGEYAQDHCPITEQSEAVGHAVRAALMYTGLAAVGIETGEDKYLDASRRIWDNVVETKLHISGGIGAVHNEERFGFQYDLPNDAYLETCAGVALAFWAGEMHRAFGEAKYIDAFECALYNNILPSLSQDGTHYFYENPLVSDGTVERWNWHGCPCCPPMFLKLIGALQDYIYSISTDSIYVNLHMGSELCAKINDTDVKITQSDCTLPWNGGNKITVNTSCGVHFNLAVRVPAWAENVTVTIDGKTFTSPNEAGYITIERTWNDGDFAVISMDLPAVKIEAHPYVDADLGKIALQRGPILYCLEEVDNKDGIDVLLGDDEIETFELKEFESAVGICGKTADGKAFKSVPYYLWNNRGLGKMAVWIRQQKANMGDTPKGGKTSQEFAAHSTSGGFTKLDTTGWDGKLYRRFYK